MQLKLITAPTITPFTLPEAKDFLRVYHNEEDGTIARLISAVVDIAERITSTALFTQTWRMYRNAFPRSNCESTLIELPKPPLQSVTSVKYYNDGGVLTTVDTSGYLVDAVSTPGRIALMPDTYWPYAQYGRHQAVEIDFVAGYAHRGAMPEGLRQALYYTLAHLYDIRESVVVGNVANEVPRTLSAAYSPYRVWTFH